MDGNEHRNERRDFLQGAVLAAASFGVTQVIASANAADKPAAPAGNVAADFQRWLDSIPGKHKQVYDAPEPNGGFALITAWVFLHTGQIGYGVPESDLGVAVVLRHNAIPLAFNDAMWTKYKLGEMFKINDPATKAPALRNPFANVKPGDLPSPEMSIDKLAARGVRFAACNMALTHYSAVAAQKAGMEPDKVRQEWLAAVLPAVQVAPSGVLAVNGAQARGCTYCFAG
jgi:intracellular sulfur oxidation DsrE/DsrF family protein